MGPFYNKITEKQADLIRESKFFFVGSTSKSAPDGSAEAEHAGPVNISPKGGAELKIIDENTVAFLDFPGSGNETAKHAKAGGDVTVMVMSYGPSDAAIVRLYGKARVMKVDKSPLAQSLLATSTSKIFLRPRQIIEVSVYKTQTSCGYGVPVLEFVRERGDGDSGRRFKDPKP